MDFLKFHPRFSGNRDSGANLKKVLALVLAFACAFTMFAGAAFTDQADIKSANTEAVDTLVALGVINGYTDGSFKPNGTVTRAEMAKMIYTIRSGGNSDASAYSGISTSFTDVNGHWAAGYIKYCQTMGIIAGKNAKTFDPNGKVTVAETAKMALVTMGYKADKSNLTGATWMVNTINLANDNELLTDVSGAVNVAASRQDAAQILYNMLDADVQSWSTDKLDYEKESETVSGSTLVVDKDGKTTVNAYTTTQYVDVGKKYLGLSKPEGTLSSVKKEDGKDTYKIVVGGVTYSKVTANYIDLLGEDVKVMIKDGKTDKVYGVYETDKNTVVSALLDDVDDINSPNKGKLKIDGTSYKTNTEDANDLPVLVTPDLSNLTVVKNSKDVNATVKDAKDAYPYYTVKFVDKDDDDKLDYAIATPYAVAQVDYLTTSKLTLSAKGNTVLGKLTYDLKDDDITLYNGAAEDDYAVVVESKYTVDDTTVVTKAETVSGAAARTKGTISDVYVGGNWYTVVGYTADSHSGYDNIKINDEYDFASVGSFVFAGEKTKGNISASNVLYVEKCGPLKSGIADGVEAKVYFADGSSKTITVTELTVYSGNTSTDKDIVAADPDTDEISNDNAATEIGKAKLFTYTEKNGEYSLDPISKNNIGSYDDYTSEDSTTIDDGKTTAKVRFADDGVIFVNDKDGVKVVSGKTVTNWKTIKDIKVEGLYDKNNGTKYIAIGAINLGSKTAKTDTRVYGYVTGAISTGTEDHTDYLYFNVYTADGEKEVKVESTAATKKIERESFIAFDWANEEAKEIDSDDIEIKTTSKDATAIAAYVDGDSITYIVKDAKTDKYVEKTLDFADDYYVVGVDTKNREGSAAKLATAKDAPNDSTKYQSNAIVFTTKDGDNDVVEAVFIDVSGAMYTTKNGTELTIDKPADK